MAYQSKAVTKHVNDTRGSVLLPMLILGGFISVTAITVLFSFQARQKVMARTQAREDVQNLSSNLKMLFSSRDACKANLVSGGLGGTLNELQSGSQAKNLKILYTAIDGTKRTMIAPNQTIDRLVVKEIFFERISSIDSPDATSDLTTYIGNLRVNLADTYANSLREIVLPMYLTRDASGAMTDCFVTSYPDPKAPDVTMEDILCQQLRQSANFHYSPREHGCSNKPITNPIIIGGR